MVAKSAYDHNRAVRDVAALRGALAHLQQFAEVQQLLVDQNAVINGLTVLGDATFVPQVGGFTGQPVITQTDVGTGNVTQTTATAITKAYAIPVNDLVVGTKYRLTAYGGGQQGSTQQQLNITYFGVTISVGATAIWGVSQFFSWEASAEFAVSVVGSSGSCSVKLSFTSQNNAIGTAANNISLVQSGARSIDTTAVNFAGIQMFWTANVGAPAIQCLGSSMERMGP